MYTFSPLRVREDNLVDGADGGGQDDDRVEGLVDSDAAGEDGRVGEPDAHAVAVEALVQRRLRQSQDVARRRPLDESVGGIIRSNAS